MRFSRWRLPVPGWLIISSPYPTQHNLEFLKREDEKGLVDLWTIRCSNSKCMGVVNVFINAAQNGPFKPLGFCTMNTGDATESSLIILFLGGTRRETELVQFWKVHSGLVREYSEFFIDAAENEPLKRCCVHFWAHGGLASRLLISLVDAQI